MNVLQPKMKRNKQSPGFMVNWTNMARESCLAPMDTHCNYTFTNWPTAYSQGNGVYLGFYSLRKRTHLSTMQQDTCETRDGAWEVPAPSFLTYQATFSAPSSVIRADSKGMRRIGKPCGHQEYPLTKPLSKTPKALKGKCNVRLITVHLQRHNL